MTSLSILFTNHLFGQNKEIAAVRMKTFSQHLILNHILRWHFTTAVQFSVQWVTSEKRARDRDADRDFEDKLHHPSPSALSLPPVATPTLKLPLPSVSWRPRLDLTSDKNNS